MLLSMKYEIEFFSTIHSNLVLIPCSSNKGLMEKNENTENKTIFQSKFQKTWYIQGNIIKDVFYIHDLLNLIYFHACI